MFPLVILFILWPILELTLLIRMGHAAGAWNTLAVVVLTGLAGAALARREGLKVWNRIQQELAAGRVPGDQLLDALLILAAGVMLVLPGLITDVLGLLLLLPPVRGWVRNRLKKRFSHRFTLIQPGQSPPAAGDDFIDVQARETDRPSLDQHDRA